MGSTEECHYDRRVARNFRLVADNVLWFDWCGSVYDVPRGTYDLSIFFRNIAAAGGAHLGFVLGVRCSWYADVNGDSREWHPNLKGWSAL